MTKKDTSILPKYDLVEHTERMDIGDNRYSTFMSSNQNTMIKSQPDDKLGRLKKYKWWILAVVLVLIVSLTLGLTLGGKDKPAPSAGVYNPYSIDTIITKPYVITGTLTAS